ncbi:hypothetical protein VNO77_22267 [Canavalia gladiata]|uniref:J domain-containing protein n=1 Tax=Canavalia gladiata TaxID=3824 RepID=A0AAN9L2A0_CANGL
MEVVSLTSSLSICKPLNFLAIPNKHKKAARKQFGVSCRGTKQVVAGHENLYKILRLSSNNATMDDIKRAYRSMALQYHPDVCHDGSKKEESTRMFMQVKAAYSTLSNPRLRAEYDYELGLRNRKSVGDESWRLRWEEQLVELKRRSHRRMAQKEGSSWGTTVRAHNIR